MRVGLTTHPRVMRIAECLLESGAFNEWAGLTYSLAGFPPAEPAQAREDRHGALRVTRYVTVTALLRFWGYANEHAKGDAIAGIWPEDVDEVTGVPGFAEAIEAAGWVVFDRKSGGLSMPNFEEHNTSSSERSNAGAERQKRYRERKKQQAENPSVDTVTRDVTRDVTLQEREEKRREESGAPVTRKKNKTPIPANFGISESVIDWAKANGYGHLQSHLDCFRLKCAAHGYQYANWDKAFMNAIAADWAKVNGKPKPGQVVI
jgi:hypothetical protein